SSELGLRGQRINTFGALARGLVWRSLRITWYSLGSGAIPGQKLAHPSDFLFIVTGRYLAPTRPGFFVAPVRGHPVFGKVVHFPSPDLHLETAPLLVSHDRMQRTITVGFRP